MTTMQLGFGDVEQASKHKRAQRELPLSQVAPWHVLLALIDPHYLSMAPPSPQPCSLATILRISLLEQWHSLSDQPMEEEPFNRMVSQLFTRRGSLDNIPNESTTLSLRLIPKAHALVPVLFKCVNAHFVRKGQSLPASSLANATVMAAMSSTQNVADEREPELHHAKKCNQQRFRAKTNICMGNEFGPPHCIGCSTRRDSGITHSQKESHCNATKVCGDSDYTNTEKPWKPRCRRGRRDRVWADRGELMKASLRAHDETLFEDDLANLARLYEVSSPRLDKERSRNIGAACTVELIEFAPTIFVDSRRAVSVIRQKQMKVAPVSETARKTNRFLQS
jgi:transposase, IS5 family